jgi:hypothetical protein
MIGRLCGALLAVAGCLAAASPAAAQGFFESFFGRHQPRYIPPSPLPPHASSYADPSHYGREGRYSDYGGYSGRGAVYCVRTCDGRYFPIQRLAGTTPAELCRSFCPASKTMVFSGGRIDSAIAPNGARYADLDNAFAYRDKVVENCTCNGKDGLGLAQLSSLSDPTLRPGDIVATNEGLVNYRGRGGSAEFTPIDRTAGNWSQKLSDVKIRPARPSPKIEVAAPEDKQAEKPRRKERRRAYY